MPCKPGKARKLLRIGKASKKRNKLGIFYLQLTFDPKKPTIQTFSLGEDLVQCVKVFFLSGQKILSVAL